jgi:hypothetical protein
LPVTYFMAQSSNVDCFPATGELYEYKEEHAPWGVERNSQR